MREQIETADRRRLLSRLAGDYHVQTARRAATFMSRDIVTDMTILAITRANVRQITASPEPVAYTYEGWPGSPPTACASRSASMRSPRTWACPTRTSAAG
uniref:Uncharacterized protein n=1 Tax=Phenylobacterium glaciei TaxID=2803784 RepID=A0A974P5M0_9CAUL|nr:hypothetical protein JKL49_06055 [Phenylobacterium glaciei]